MANPQHLDLLKQGIPAWNRWRQQFPDILFIGAGVFPDLKGADLRGANLRGANLILADLQGADLRGADLTSASIIRANLNGANLRGAHLRGSICFRVQLHDTDLCEADLVGADLYSTYLGETHLRKANFSEANLRRAVLSKADLTEANLSKADLTECTLIETILSRANLGGANLTGANLEGADLSGANLIGAKLLFTNLSKASLSNCRIYGISVWDVKLQETRQDNLIITLSEQPTITVDNLKVAQFIYLLLNNQEIRGAIDALSKKVVLILGRFTPRRKAILDALRNELRKHDYLPVVFDFDKPSSRNLTETVSTLAHLSRFIIADLTSAKSIPQELERIVPRLRVPVQPLLHTSEKKPYGMFESFEDYPWMLPIYPYSNKAMLLKSVREHVIEPAERKAQKYEKC